MHQRAQHVVEYGEPGDFITVAVLAHVAEAGDARGCTSSIDQARVAGADGVGDRLAPYDPRLIRDLMAAAQAVGTAAQPVAYTVSASDASLVYAAGATARIACFGHVRANSHGYEVARLAVFDNVLRTLVYFARTWSG